jgi:hypothetical protein
MATQSTFTAKCQVTCKLAAAHMHILSSSDALLLAATPAVPTMLTFPAWAVVGLQHFSSWRTPALQVRQDTTSTNSSSSAIIAANEPVKHTWLAFAM